MGSSSTETYIDVTMPQMGVSVAEGTVVYLNDAKWLGWRPLLTGANTRLADALAQIREAGADRP